MSLPRLQTTARCEDEPIHAPDLVQPHGVLLAVNPDGRISHASDSAGLWLGRPTAAVLGSDILAACGPRPQAWAAAAAAARRGLVATLPLCSDGPHGPMTASIHAHAELLLVELERDEAGADAQAQIRRRLAQAMGELAGARGLPRFLRLLTVHVRRISGFHRAMVYRFDAGFNGEVVAQSRGPELGSYLGQHFPASDIPPQARHIFELVDSRTIVDITAMMSPVLSGTQVPGQPPLDLSRSQLRAPAPVHLEYLRNMGVAASLTLSLRVGGRLWGLVACHHREARRMSPAARQACEVLGRFAAAAIEARQLQRAAGEARRARRWVERLRECLAGSADSAWALVQPGDNVLSLFPGRAGTSAAVLVAGRWASIGAPPPQPALEALAGWLRASAGRRSFFVCENLAEIYPPARAFGEAAAGLVAIGVGGHEPTLVLWFLPEVVRTIAWAGNPHKPVAGASAQRLHPRHSFALWQEYVRHRCAPVRHSERRAARGLRRVLVETSLQRQIVSEQLVRADAQAQRARAALLAEATSVVGRGLDRDASCRAFSEVVVANFADECEIYLADGDDGAMRRAHAGRAAPVAAGARAAGPALDVDAVLAMMAASGRHGGLLLSEAAEPAPLAASPATGADPADAPPPGSRLVVPMMARDTLLGLLVLARGREAAPFVAADLELAGELAGRAASAVDNALSFVRAKDALQVRDHVLGMVSHDLRNPLGVVRLSVDRLERRLERGQLDEMLASVPRTLRTVQVACQRMERLIEDILCLTKIEAGGLVAELSPHRAEVLVAEAIAQMEPLAEARAIRLAAVPPTPSAPSDRLEVACDHDRVMQVFSNLLGNAIKFSPADSAIEVAFWPRDGEVVFAVRDQGPGIAPEHLPHVFDRNWQAASTQRQGAGLGLAIVRGIVEAHGCEAAVESRRGHGATFRFALPRTSATTAEATPTT